MLKTTFGQELLNMCLGYFIGVYWGTILSFQYGWKWLKEGKPWYLIFISINSFGGLYLWYLKGFWVSIVYQIILSILTTLLFDGSMKEIRIHCFKNCNKTFISMLKKHKKLAQFLGVTEKTLSELDS